MFKKPVEQHSTLDELFEVVNKRIDQLNKAQRNWRGLCNEWSAEYPRISFDMTVTNNNHPSQVTLAIPPLHLVEAAHSPALRSLHKRLGDARDAVLDATRELKEARDAYRDAYTPVLQPRFAKACAEEAELKQRLKGVQHQKRDIIAEASAVGGVRLVDPTTPQPRSTTGIPSRHWENPATGRVELIARVQVFKDDQRGGRLAAARPTPDGDFEYVEVPPEDPGQAKLRAAHRQVMPPNTVVGGS